MRYIDRHFYDRFRVKSIYCRRKNLRRAAAFDGKLARDYLLSVALGAAIAPWLWMDFES